ncbi:hypothetical protein KKB55_08565 [Myxococcota bacterium]|nr:hypothetical protein [Myxococcota bacterium]MBU1897793.1 hypothetical protein [Myxococcota bacterium]
MVNIDTSCFEGTRRNGQWIKAYRCWTKERVGLLDQLFLLAWPIIATLITYYFDIDFFPAMNIFLLTPNIYLAWRLNWKIKRSVNFSLVMGVPLAILIDYVMQASNAWALGESIFGDVRLFGLGYIEQVPWLALFALFVVLTYRLLIGEAPRDDIKGKMPFHWLTIWHIFLFSGFVALWLYDRSLLVWDYTYLKVGLVIGVLPSAYAIGRNHYLSKRFLLPAAYFVYFSLIYEWISLHMGHWSFPNEDQFIGYVTFFGHAFPYEELIFWIILGPLFCLSYFEVFGGERALESR